ncbi:MAG: AzlC family ABC transporter permease [Acidimicrobiia bacterium]
MTIVAPISSRRQGLRDTLPLVPPLIVFGLVYGALAARVGFSPVMAALSSLLIVSGSAQLAMVGLIPFGAGPVLAATTGLALRHVPMAIHLSDLFGPLSVWRRLHLAWILVDESYGLTVAAAEKAVPDLVAYKTASDVTLYSFWVITTFLGATLGSQLDPARYGLEAVIPLVFLGLAAAIIRGWRRWLAAGLALVTTAAAVVWLPTAWQVTAAALVAAALATAVPERSS